MKTIILTLQVLQFKVVSTACLKNSKYQNEFFVLDNLLMGLQIIVSAHATVEIINPYNKGLSMQFQKQEFVLEGFEWNERSNNTEKNSNVRFRSEAQYIFEWFQARKHVKNEPTQARNKLRHEYMQTRKIYIGTQAREK